MKKFIVIISTDGEEIWKKETNQNHMPGEVVYFDNQLWIVTTQSLDGKTAEYVYLEMKEKMIELAHKGKRFEFLSCSYCVYETPFYSEEICIINTTGIYHDPINITWRRNLN